MARRTKSYLLDLALRPDADAKHDEYPFNLPAVRDIQRIAFAVALGFGAEGGTKNVQFRTVESVSSLHRALRLARGVPRPRIREVAYEDTGHYSITRDF